MPRSSTASAAIPRIPDVEASRPLVATLAPAPYARHMTAPLLAPTPPHLLVDRQNRPYFLWDCEDDASGEAGRRLHLCLVVGHRPPVALRGATPREEARFLDVDPRGLARTSWPLTANSRHFRHAS